MREKNTTRPPLESKLEKNHTLHAIVKTDCSSGRWSSTKKTSSKMGSISSFQLHNLFWLNPDLVVGVEVAFILVAQAISKGRGHLVHHLSFIGVEVPEGRLAGETPRETAMISLKRDLPFSNQD
jgi:hypothetical protein